MVCMLLMSLISHSWTSDHGSNAIRGPSPDPREVEPPLTTILLVPGTIIVGAELSMSYVLFPNWARGGSELTMKKQRE